MSKRRKIKLLVGSILIVMNFVLIFYRSSISSLTLNIIFAGMFTTVFYLMYDDKLEKFDNRIKRLKRNFDTKVHYDSEHERYTYSHFGNVLSRESFLELIKLSCLLSTQKAEKIVEHLEKESRGIRN